MLDAAVGLTEVATRHLKQLLALVHRGELNYPINVQELARTGFQHCAAPLLGQLRGLEGPAVRAVLIAVLAERLPANQKRLAKASAGAST